MATRSLRKPVKKARTPQNYRKSVFVNCPFDVGYRPLLRPLLFTIYALGFTPRLALDRADCGENRLEKIIGLIRESKWAIHDLSRCVAQKKGEHYRMNMPFELGMDHGARVYGSAAHQGKRYLILEQERFRFQAALSDLSGCDIKAHNNEPATVVRIVHDWLVQEAGATSAGPTKVWKRFNVFVASHYKKLKAEGYTKADLEKLPESALSTAMLAWLKDNPI